MLITALIHHHFHLLPEFPVEQKDSKSIYIYIIACLRHFFGDSDVFGNHVCLLYIDYTWDCNVRQQKDNNLVPMFLVSWKIVLPPAHRVKQSRSGLHLALDQGMEMMLSVLTATSRIFPVLGPKCDHL